MSHHVSRPRSADTLLRLQVGAGFLMTLFGEEKFEVTWGDSTKTLPRYMDDHPELVCDGIMVDGGHNYRTSKADLSAFLTRARCGSRVSRTTIAAAFPKDGV